MTESELQALSREVAGLLPNDFGNGRLDKTGVGTPNGWAKFRPHGEQWLHESTEACAEIMVRIIAGPNSSTWALTGTEVWYGNEPTPVGTAPMLAFRIAVLKAAKSVLGGE